MTVKELIELLRHAPQDAAVLVRHTPVGAPDRAAPVNSSRFFSFTPDDQMIVLESRAVSDPLCGKHEALP